jgi:flagellar hook protein FlgE
MDVIGNNIANVNTVGFRRSRVAFHDMLGQKMLGIGQTIGGATVGNGATVGSIDQAWSQGSFEYTNLATDLALGGDGFFVVRGAEGNALTRSGNFQFNADGQLITANGMNVQGWAYNPDGTINTGALQDVQIELDATAPPEETGNVTLGGNLSADLVPNEDGSEATMSTVVYDAQGQSHTLVLTFGMTDADTWTLTTAQIAGDPDAEPPVPPTDLTGSGIELDFDIDGNIIGPDPATIDLSGVFPGSNGDDLAITLDVGAMTQFGGSSTANVSSQDGQAAGRLIGYGIDPSGSLVLSFSNGEQRAIAQLAIGTVANPNGLEQLGDNFYGLTAGAGDLVLGRAGEEINTAVISGALETSNVDLAAEFTDMIVTQRGYQASARVITTSDEMLQEVVQLKR